MDVPQRHLSPRPVRQLPHPQGNMHPWPAQQTNAPASAEVQTVRVLIRQERQCGQKQEDPLLPPPHRVFLKIVQ